MIPRFWAVVIVVVVAGVAAALLLLRPPATQSPVADAIPEAGPVTPATTATPAAPATKTAEPVRQSAGYDHYRAEMKRIRAEREKAGALEANERCIGGQRFRKVGSAWERAGNC